MNELVDETEPIECQNPVVTALKRIGKDLISMLDWIFGFLVILVGLAFLAVIPILNFLSLGYLLQASGKVAITGRLRDGFPGIRKASVMGSIVLGTWLVFWPVRFVSGLWKDAEIVASGSVVAGRWRVALISLTIFTVWHVIWSCFRGGKLRHFLRPAPIAFLRRMRSLGKPLPGMDSIVDFFFSLRLVHYFWLGLRGFVGGIVWLSIPVGLLIVASRLPPGGAALLSLFGGLVLMVVVLYLPFLQTQFAATGKFDSLFDIRQIRRMFTQAPLAFLIALLVTLLFAVPLYLLKIELTPKEIAWLPSLMFVVFIYPARLLTGWAMSRACRREDPRHFITRWFGRLAMIPVAFFYVLIAYLTQYLSWYGSLSLLEQHAFMVPAPLMSL